MVEIRPQIRLPPAVGSAPVHLLHIGKTGGTAIKAALRPYRAAAGIQYHKHQTTLADLPPGERVVFFVRDPISRFVSGFNSRLRKGLPRYDVPWNDQEKEAFSLFQTPDQLAAALSARDLALRERAYMAMLGIRHVKTSYRDWFGDEQALEARLADIVFIGLQEELNSDFEALKTLLNIPPEAALPKDDVSTHRTPDGLDRALSPEAEANLKEWFAEDVRFYSLFQRIRRERLCDRQ
jgi:hypothetical protein